MARLDEIPGVGPTAAAVIIAEIGVDMTRFPTAAHLASWARFAPGVKESAGRKKGNGATGHGNRYLARALGEAAVGRRQDRHLPRRTLPAHRPPTRQEEGHRRRRPLHPGHHLAPAIEPRRPLPRPRPRLLRHPARHPSRHRTTSADSKHSATESPSNPPPDSPGPRQPRTARVRVTFIFELDGMAVTARVGWVVAGRGLTHTDSWVTEQGLPARPIRHVWEAPVFSERTSVGLDVHARSVVAAAIDGVTGEVFKARLTPDHRDVLRWVQGLPGPAAVDV